VLAQNEQSVIATSGSWYRSATYRLLLDRCSASG
jgi:hypothetical protein